MGSTAHYYTDNDMAFFLKIIIIRIKNSEYDLILRIAIHRLFTENPTVDLYCKLTYFDSFITTLATKLALL